MRKGHLFQSAHSSFDDSLTVQPWRVLVDDICQNLDSSTFSQLVFFSKDLLSKHGKDHQRFCGSVSPEIYVEYFSTLEDCLGENAAVEHLEHLISTVKFYGGSYGETDYKEWIKKYREAKTEYLQRCAEKGITLDKNFVGRELLLEDVIKYLKQDYKGVILCGLSGMGKTSFASQVCSRLMYHKPMWNIIVINQREKSELNELLVDLVSELSDELCVSEQKQFVSGADMKYLTIQCGLLLTELVEKKQNTLIFLDNMDGHCETRKQQDFSQLMKELLFKIPTKSNVKFLMTVGKKLSNITQIANEKNVIMDGQMVEQELKPLTSTDTAKVLRQISDKSELTESVCHRIHSLCGGIPFSISMVGDLIKNGYDPETLLSGLQYQPQAISMDMFLQKSFQMLGNSAELRELMALLVRLSVFQTACFNIQAAVSVCSDTSKEDKFKKPVSVPGGMILKDTSVRDNMWIKLQQLKSHFLLEVNDAFSSLGRRKMSSEKQYSLHPLVVRYVKSLCDEDENLKSMRESAKMQFLNYVCAEIEKLGEKCDKDPLIARNLLDANMVHIKEFFQIVRKEKLLLTLYLPQKDPNKHRMSASVAVQRRRIWKIAEWAISSLERKLFARRQAEMEKEAKNLFSYIYWQSLEAESLLTQDKMQLTLQLIDAITNELGIVTDDTVCSKVEEWNKPLDEEIPAWATFYTVKGRLYFMKSRNNNEKNMHERAMQFLNIAEELFEGQRNTGSNARNHYSKKYFQTDVADVKNLKGCVCFLMKNYKMSKQYHEMAYSIILKLTGNQLHKNLTEYQTNMAACYHQWALDTHDEGERNTLFQKALKLYDQSVGNNKRMKCEMMPSQAGTLRNRAEIYYRQEVLDKALADGKEVLKIVRNIYVSPHIEITLALERLAHYHLKIGKKKQKEMDVEGQNHLEQAMQFYDEVLMHIQNGGLPIENNDARTYRHIRENHIKVMKLLRYDQRLMDDRIRKYQAFEAGKYNKSIQHNLQHDLDFVPHEFLKQAIEEGAVFEPISMDDSDSESSETSSSDGSRPSSSSKSSSAGIGSPQQMMDVEQVVALRRHDSGVEETEMSDEEMIDADIGEAIKTKAENSTDLMNTREINTEDKDSIVKSGQSEEENVFINKTDYVYKKHELGKKLGSSLKRQASIDLPDVMEQEESQNDEVVELKGLSTSSYADSTRESWSSSVSSASFESRRKSSTNESRDSWRGSRLSSSFGSQKVHDTWSSTGSDPGVLKRRESWLSTGSQDSVTSQMGHMLNLDDFEDNDEGDADKPYMKRKKTDHQEENKQ